MDISNYRRPMGLVFVAVTLVVAMLGATVKIGNKTALTATAANAVPTVIVDAGHGGFDGGASVADGTVEKDINLAVSLKLIDILKAWGFNVLAVRTTDCAVNDTGSTIRQKKHSDLTNRMKLMTENPGSIYLCIHQNIYVGASSHGAQTFFTPGNEQSKKLASLIQQSVISLVQQDNTRVIKPCGDSVYLIHHAPTTAVLVECGFLSNQRDLKNLKDTEYQRKLAFAIGCGLLGYINGG